MYSIIILLFSCFLALTQALPSTIERDVSHADAISALVEREPSISVGGSLAVSACWTTLSCSFHQIEDMNMQTRLQFMLYLQDRFASLNAADQFRAIQGDIQFFIDAGQGGPGTWVSYVGAGIVEAVQRGGAMALGIGASDGGNPGSAKWAEFLTNMKNGRLNNRNVSQDKKIDHS